MSGREYTDLVMDDNIDENRMSVDILRTSFLYEGHYFQIETCTNISGGPTFLRLENHENGDVTVPPYIKVLKDVTTDEHFTTKHISRPDFKMNW